jgi:hypothetical protein
MGLERARMANLLMEHAEAPAVVTPTGATWDFFLDSRRAATRRRMWLALQPFSTEAGAKSAWRSWWSQSIGKYVGSHSERRSGYSSDLRKGCGPAAGVIESSG